VLHSDKAKNGIGERQPGGNRAKHRDEGRKTDTKEEQPHTPTGQITGHIHFHRTLSLSRLFCQAHASPLTIQTQFDALRYAPVTFSSEI